MAGRGVEAVRAPYVAAGCERVDEGEQLNAVPKQREHIRMVAPGDDGPLVQQLPLGRSLRSVVLCCVERHQPLDCQRTSMAGVGQLRVSIRRRERISAVHDRELALADGTRPHDGEGGLANGPLGAKRVSGSLDICGRDGTDSRSQLV